MNLGGVQTPTILDCPRCEEKVIIGVGHVLRIPADHRGRSYCHETVDPRTGDVFKRGGPPS